MFKLVSSKKDPDGINSLFETILEELIDKNILKVNDSFFIKNKKQEKKQKKCCQ